MKQLPWNEKDQHVHNGRCMCSQLFCSCGPRVISVAETQIGKKNLDVLRKIEPDVSSSGNNPVSNSQVDLLQRIEVPLTCRTYLSQCGILNDSAAQIQLLGSGEKPIAAISLGIKSNPTIQASFLAICYSHYLLTKLAAVGKMLWHSILEKQVKDLKMHHSFTIVLGHTVWFKDFQRIMLSHPGWFGDQWAMGL